MPPEKPDFQPLPKDYVVEQLRIYAQNPIEQHNGNWRAGCPICREGSGWGITQRLYYLPLTNWFHCHNCGWDGNAMKWVCEVTGKRKSQVMKEAGVMMEDIDYHIRNTNRAAAAKISASTIEKILCTLPQDAINLSDTDVIERMYRKGQRDMMPALRYAISRRLMNAVNRGKLFYSPRDPLHNGRLIIPFYDINKRLTFFQSRTINPDDSMRYIGSRGFNKNLYGVERLDPDADYIFVQEGPLNVFFLTNSVGLAGISKDGDSFFTAKQLKEINALCYKRIIWILDNPKYDTTAETKLEAVRRRKDAYFLWPDTPEFEDVKDTNDWCQKHKKDSFPESLVFENLATYPY